MEETCSNCYQRPAKFSYYKGKVCKECRKAFWEIRSNKDTKELVSLYSQLKVNELAERFKITHQAVVQKIQQAEAAGVVDYSELKMERKREAIKEADKYNRVKFKNQQNETSVKVA